MSALTYNPLHCMDCNLEVIPESLALSDALVEAVASWRSTYDAIDRLWLDSGDYESWALAQLADLGSPVNRRGLAVRRDLDGVRRCYYWYFQDQSAEGFEPVKDCPGCHERFAMYQGGILPQLVCDRCSIVTVRIAA